MFLHTSGSSQVIRSAMICKIADRHNFLIKNLRRSVDTWLFLHKPVKMQITAGFFVKMQVAAGLYHVVLRVKWLIYYKTRFTLSVFSSQFFFFAFRNLWRRFSEKTFTTQFFYYLTAFFSLPHNTHYLLSPSLFFGGMFPPVVGLSASS